MNSQQQVIDSLPIHLRPFVAVQDYQRYTPRDHAVWRFLLHQLVQNLQLSAHPVYTEGLRKTGIDLEAIPHIDAINDHLQLLGWQAVVVDGFLPPAIFMEFQAHKVLVIAVDMRSYEHMLYTPAPDIVHEAAGHAPFIVDVDYAEFLQRFGELGMRAISNKYDMAVYEAIRKLSIIKESPTATVQEIDSAEAALQQAIEDYREPSEAALLARLHWWTVEYGLVGDIDNYTIFGAGLLSSLGESVNCLSDQVSKKPLTVDAINTPYDITCEQPQLFVTKNCRHLTQVLEEFGRKMAVNVGGLAGLEQAIAAETVNTAVGNSGIEISGKIIEARTDAVGNVVYLKTDGPTQLAYQGKELAGQGIEQHPHGFGSPLGAIISFERCLSHYTVDELAAHGIRVDDTVTLEFLSGITVTGVLKHIVRQQQKNLIFTFDQCTVTTLAGEVLFDPSWGAFDMAVMDDIVSVYGGSADKTRYPLYAAPSTQTTLSHQYNVETQTLFDLYQQVRDMRELSQLQPEALQNLIEMVDSRGGEEWLLLYETIELATKYGLQVEDLQQKLTSCLDSANKKGDQQVSQLIRYALERLSRC